METITITVGSFRLNFDSAWKIFWAVAKSYNPHTSRMAWFDRKQGRHSPSPKECDAAGLPGWEEYGRIYGGRRKVVVGEEDYVFIYT
ncbi:MAG: AF1514 family protein [Deltaproteobacteria bacterium]|nr:AF1514 family protein [Deltaproteobacteria bacterium]